MVARSLAAWLFLLPLVAFGAPAQDGEAEAGWTVADGSADLRPLVPVGVSYPQTPLGAHVDVTEVAIRGEDELGFMLDIRVAQLNVATQSFFCCLAQSNFFATFKLASSPIVYDLNIFVSGSDTNANTASTFQAMFIGGQLCLSDPEEGQCFYQPVFPTLDDEADTIHVYIPKRSLLGLLEQPDFFFSEGRPPGVATKLNAGDMLMDFELTSSYTPGLLLFAANMQDDVPDDGAAPPYRFERGMANSVIELALGDEEVGSAVESGANQSLPFTVTNKAAGKRLVQLEYEIVGDDESTKLFRAFGPASVTVPGGQTRNFSLSLDVGAAGPEHAVILKVRGTSVGHADEIGLGSVRLVPSASLGPGSDTLYMHAQRFDFIDPTLSPAFCNTFLFGGCTFPFLSPLQTHPLATEGARVGSGGLSFNDGGPQDSFFIQTELPTAGPIMFDREAPIEVDLSLVSTVPAQAAVTATIAYSSEETNDLLFEATAPASLSATPTVVTLSGPPRFNPDVRPFLPADTWMVLRVEITYDLASPGTVTWASSGAEIDPAESQIRLPLVELPDDLRREPVASDLQISSVDEPEDFVNPGEGRLYNVTVLNQADHVLRFELSATSNEPWGQLVLPGTQFEVGAGDTVTFGVLVQADANATEGDLGLTTVNATTVAAPGQNASTVSLQLRTIVTKFDLPDDSTAYVADPDDASKLVEENAENTPGLGMVGLVAAVALGAAAWTRGRRKP